MPDDRPPHCDALALAAGQLPREALEEMAEVQNAGRLADLGGNVGRRAPRNFMLKLMLSRTSRCG